MCVCVCVYTYMCVCVRVCVCARACAMEYYSAIKKNKIMPFAATRMDLENTILSEVSLKEKDKYHMITLICKI